MMETRRGSSWAIAYVAGNAGWVLPATDAVSRDGYVMGARARRCNAPPVTARAGAAMAAAWDAGYMAGLTGAPRWAPDIYDGMADRAWRAGWTFATSGGFCLA